VNQAVVGAEAGSERVVRAVAKGRRDDGSDINHHHRPMDRRRWSVKTDAHVRTVDGMNRRGAVLRPPTARGFRNHAPNPASGNQSELHVSS